MGTGIFSLAIKQPELGGHPSLLSNPELRMRVVIPLLPYMKSCGA